MYKCKNCGAEFESKFCPNCGEVADGAEVLDDMERTLRQKGVPNIWMREKNIEKAIFAVLIAIGLGVAIAVIIKGVEIYRLFDGFISRDPISALLVYDAYRADMKTLCITLAVLASIMIIIMNFGSLFLTYSKIKWVRSKNIDAPAIITAGVIADKDGDKDYDQFLETKRILYDADRHGSIRQHLIITIVESIAEIVSGILAAVWFFNIATTLSATGERVLAEISAPQIVAIVALFVVPEIIMHFIKKGIQKKKPKSMSGQNTN